ncbi:MAG TPA: S41 family peptidase [Planctomycetota bacterium]|nr:S41 family peptidase [Planctomycetota bacterium]
MASRTLAWLVFFALLCALGLRMHGKMQAAEQERLAREQATYQYLRKLIRDNYVREVDDRKLFYGAMNGMASSLDRHSQFMPPQEFEQLKTQTTGQYEGVGIEFDPDESRGLIVLTPLENTPAYRSGILPGDRILKIDGVSTEGMTREEAGRRIKGPPGSTVRLTLLHEGHTEPQEVTLTRAVNEMKSVQVAEILAPPVVPETFEFKIGHVQISQFQQRTGSDLDAVLKRLESRGMQALVLDLRQNPGGLLEAAQQVADLFLKDGPIVTVITRADAQSKEKGATAYAEEPGTHPDYPLAVLVDQNSASASEVVAGALKDRGRAVLVGDRTYGKFSVQDVFRVPLGKWGESALKLTIARYQTPSSPCVDGQGLIPDYPVPFTLEQQRALQMSRIRRHIKDNDPRGAANAAVNKKDKQPPEPFDDLQLKKAAEVLAEMLKQKKPAQPAPSAEPVSRAK